MEPNKRTIEKILTQALELHEKGVSLHSIVRTYPTYKNEIEELFSAMALVAKKSVPIAVPEAGLERLLRALPEDSARTSSQPIQSPFSSFWSTIHVTNWKFLVPVAALALLTGGLIVSKHATAPLNPTTTPNMLATNPSAGTATGMQPLAAATPHTTVNKTDQTVAMVLGSTATESNIMANETTAERTAATSDASYLNNPIQ